MWLAQTNLHVPRGLRRSELTDWYCDRGKAGRHVCVSRRFVLATVVAAPIVAVDPFDPGPGLAPRPVAAEPFSLAALIAVLISVLDLVDRAYGLAERIRADVELDNTGSDDPKEGNLLAASYDERDYVENAVQIGTGLSHYHPAAPPQPRLVPDGPEFQYTPLVPGGIRYRFPVDVQPKRPGPKRMETMTRLNLKSAPFEVTP